ncbi:MAG TPA: hypothetical protein VK519_06175 [Pinirhizobacter sp.]|uniref:hypothetical protein n=1 Tax=Pinirhizobacter sp. TaxID=2950432 RepID=UPI002C881BBF|nr:hypothetical protein [Pinirhizobacter sp.]HMH67489.1 hypothetical protein [Pinirhizobacter sp.]
MSDDLLDQLVVLYRTAARETAAPQMDDRVLRYARQREFRGLGIGAIGLGLALAASMLLWVSMPRDPGVALASPVAMDMTSAAPGYSEGRSQSYLMQMDVRPPDSPVAQYLRQHTP